MNDTPTVITNCDVERSTLDLFFCDVVENGVQLESLGVGGAGGGGAAAAACGAKS